MRYHTAAAACVGCGETFVFNPGRVPTAVGPSGQREPVCRSCIRKLNLMRAHAGLQPVTAVRGAYGEEAEL